MWHPFCPVYVVCFSHGIDSIVVLSPVLVVRILFSSFVLFIIKKKISSSVSWQNVIGIEQKPDILLKHVLCYQRTGMCPC